ncbi:DUF6660 family protein [Chryseosolibacter indicus]|uniref:DUF6660 family protein n=1 Tax=Chryseosolibacter indicus TaxID=2782351 RepID=UPI00345FC184
MRYFCHVKIFCILFGFLLSALSCYPCTDGETCADDTERQASVISHDHSTDDVDSCSPLCVCSCCSMKIHSPSSFHLEIFRPGFVIKNSVHLTLVPELVFCSIWQPPKPF